MGDMGELGSHADEAHREAGRYARLHGVERLFTIGSLTPLAVRSFGDGASWHADMNDLIAAVGAELTADSRVLVKGSRLNRLERLVEALAAAPAEGRSH
jgi:UDP-N-acetylmuramoyl-tripeptide--D-alanyl-D-alanine ligase